MMKWIMKKYWSQKSLINNWNPKFWTEEIFYFENFLNRLHFRLSIVTIETIDKLDERNRFRPSPKMQACWLVWKWRCSSLRVFVLKWSIVRCNFIISRVHWVKFYFMDSKKVQFIRVNGSTLKTEITEDEKKYRETQFVGKLKIRRSVF